VIPSIIIATGMSLEWWQAALILLGGLLGGLGAFAWLKWMDARDRRYWASKRAERAFVRDWDRVVLDEWTGTLTWYRSEGKDD